MTFSLKKLITSLIDIIISSPSSVLFIILGILFSVAMIINIKKNKTMGKTLYMIGWVFIIAFVTIKYNNYLSKIFDNLILNIIRQIFFPNIATYTIIIIITNIIFLYTIFNKKSTTSNKLINAPFFIIIMVLMVYTIELVSKNKVNIYEAKEVYTNESIRTIIESTTLIFSLWIVILLSKNILNILIEKSNNKIIEEYKNKKTPKEIITETGTLNNNQIVDTIPNIEPKQDNINQITDTIPIQTPNIEDMQDNINQITQTIPNQTPNIEHEQDNINQITDTIPNTKPIQDTINQIADTNNINNNKKIKPIIVLPKKEEENEIEVLDI